MRTMRVLALAIALLTGGSFARADTPDSLLAPASTTLASAGVTADSAASGGSPVLLEGREIFRIQAGIKGYTTEERARAISERILRLAKDRRTPVDSIRAIDTDISTDVVVGDMPLFSVFDGDAQAAGRDRLALARERALASRAAIEHYRSAHAARRILMGVLWAIVATAIFALYLRILARALRAILAWIDKWIESRSEGIRRRSKAIIAPERIQTGLRSLARLARAILVVIGVYVYLEIVLSLFPWTQWLAANLLDLVLGPLRSMGAAVWKSLPGLIFIGVLAFVTRAILKFASFIFDEMGAGRLTISGFYPEWSKPTYNIVRILVLVFAVVVAYPYIPGSDTDAFKGVSIFVGVLISLGSTSAVSNIVAGIILTYMRAFKVGDVIGIGEQRGVVTEMSLLATHLVTPKHVEVTIPNATVLSSHATNFSTHAKDRGLILNTSVGIGYDVPWRQVHAMLLTAARQTGGILEKPAPFVLQRSLEDMCIRYELNAYTDRPEQMLRIYSELHKRILDSFNEYGVQIMTPNYEGDRSEPAVVAKERWYAAPAKKPGEPGADE